MMLKEIVVILFCFATVRADPPEFREAFANVSALENTLLKILCNASGDPEPQYSWYNESADELGPDSYPPVQILHERNETLGSYSWLIFNRTMKIHSGLYTCTAKNSHGLRSKLYEVTIYSMTDEDQIKINGVDVTNVTDTTVSFRVHFSGKSDVCNVSYNETVRSSLRKTLQFSGEEIVVENLIPSGKYSFSFSTRTPQGGWKIWTTIEVVLLPSVPEVIFNSLSGGLLKIQWFRKFDDVSRNTIDKHLLSYFTVQMQGGNDWIPSSCNMTIEIPQCFSSSYTLASLQKNVYYEIVLKAHTAAGYGKPYRNKIYIA